MNKIVQMSCAVALASLSAGAFAQCSVTSTISAVGSVAGNTCGHNAGFTPICGGTDSTNNKGLDAFQVTVGASQNFTITVTSTTANFNPELAVIGSPCATTTNCIIDDTAGATAGPDTFSGQPAGTYFILVTDLNAEAPGCGDYNLVTAGTLPVKLQDFSVN